MNKKEVKNINIIPLIRGINIYNMYKKKNFIKNIKIYFKYINNIKIMLRYKEKIKNKLFIKLIKICYINNINITINFKFYNFKKKKIIKYVKYIKYVKVFIKSIKNIKKIFININYQCNNIYKWYNFYKEIIFLCKCKKINNIIFINYLNKFKYLNNIILLKIVKLFKIYINKKIFLLLSLYKKIFNVKIKVIQLINCILNKNIFLVLSEINNLYDIEYILYYTYIKKIGWWITPKKYKFFKKKNKKNKLLNFSSILYLKNGIRQTSIKDILKPLNN